MRFKPPICKRLQGAADARRRARRRTFVLQVPDNKADAVPCERLKVFQLYPQRHGIQSWDCFPSDFTVDFRSLRAKAVKWHQLATDCVQGKLFRLILIGQFRKDNSFCCSEDSAHRTDLLCCCL